MKSHQERETCQNNLESGARLQSSVFFSFASHYGPNGASMRYFSDLYIPSYTTQYLSALIKSRKGSLQTLGKPSLLLVAEPDHSDTLP